MNEDSGFNVNGVSNNYQFCIFVKKNHHFGALNYFSIQAVKRGAAVVVAVGGDGTLYDLNSYLGIVVQFMLLTVLIAFGLSNNDLSGPLPRDIWGGKRLQALILFKNKLNGTLPEPQGDYPALQYVRVDNNELSGEFPSKVWSFPAITLLTLSNNL